MACEPALEEAEGMEEYRALARDGQNVSSLPPSPSWCSFTFFFFWQKERKRLMSPTRVAWHPGRIWKRLTVRARKCVAARCSKLGQQ